MTPYYNKASQAGLIRHFQVIADGVDVPLILYDVPSRTGVTIAPETYAELAKHPNINGVKEAGGNFSNIQKTRNLCPEDFSIWSGNDDETAAICMLGGKGVISVVANVLPAEMPPADGAVPAERLRRRRKAAAGAEGLLRRHVLRREPHPRQNGAEPAGWDVGPLRLPLCDPTEAGLEKIRAALEKHGLTSQSISHSRPAKAGRLLFGLFPGTAAVLLRGQAHLGLSIADAGDFHRQLVPQVGALPFPGPGKPGPASSPAGMQTLENSSWLIWPTVQGRKTRTRMSWSPWFSITRAA